MFTTDFTVLFAIFSILILIKMFEYKEEHFLALLW